MRMDRPNGTDDGRGTSASPTRSGPLTQVAHALLPHWWRSHRGDPLHPHGRRFTPKYRAKRRRVRDLWVLAGVCMVVWPTIQVVVPVLLGMTFLSFCILDETQ